MLLEADAAVIRAPNGSVVLPALTVKLRLLKPCLLLGRNGIGKSSLLRAILEAAEGSGDQRKSRLRLDPRPASVGYLPQNCIGRLNVSGWDFLLHNQTDTPGSDWFARPSALDGTHSLSLVTTAGLAGELALALSSWSIGSRRFLQTAAALGVPRELYLLDEPFANLSAAWTEILVKRIVELAEFGSRFLVVSHLETIGSEAFDSFDLGTFLGPSHD